MSAAVLRQEPPPLRRFARSCPPADGQAGLAGLVRACGTSSVARRVLLLRTDLLPPDLARPHHLRLLEAALEPLERAERSTLFHLARCRMAVAWRGDDGGVADVWATLARLLAGAAEAPSLDRLAVLFTLPTDGPALLAEIAIPFAPEPEPDAPMLAPMDAAGLDELETLLAGAELSRFVRRSSVYTVDATGVHPAWDQRWLSLQDIGAELLPGRDLGGDPWLARRLARVLDCGLMLALARDRPGPVPGQRPARRRIRHTVTLRPLALHLLCASVASPLFLQMDAVLPAAAKQGGVLGLSVLEALTDPEAFTFARDLARARGWRILVHGVTAALLPALRPRALQADLLGMVWSPGLLPLPPGAVPMLSGADSPAAMDWAAAHEVRLVAGRAAVTAAAATAAAEQD